MDLNPELIYHRLMRWLILLFGCVACFLSIYWLSEVKRMTRTWEYHAMQIQDGRLQDRMQLSDKVWLLRSRHAVGICRPDGTPYVYGMVVGISYESAARDAVLVSYTYEFSLLADNASGSGASAGQGMIAPGSAITTGPVGQLGAMPADWGLPMARIDLLTGEVQPVENYRASVEILLNPVDNYFPVRHVASAPLPLPSVSPVVR